MIQAEDVALVLLAAGRSERFGDVDKLAEPYLGRPLAMHVVTALEAVPFHARIAVVSDTAVDFARCGYRVIANDQPEAGLGRSLALCVAAAQAMRAPAVLIALADMPRVTATHIYRLLDAGDGEAALVASSNGQHPTPPALVGASHFAALTALPDDVGVRALIARGRHVVASPNELLDVDTPEQLARLRALAG